MWRWLDRERLLREERVLGRLKAKEAGQWFQRCTEARLETATARAERDNAREDLARVELELDQARRHHHAVRGEHFDEIKRIQGERERWERAAESRIVPPPSTFAASPDRENALRLAEENSVLRQQLDAARASHEALAKRHNDLCDEYLTERARLMDKLAKYEGNPS